MNKIQYTSLVNIMCNSNGKTVICYVVVSHGLDCSSSLVDPEISTGKMSDVMSFHIRQGKAATTPFSFGVAELHSGLLLPKSISPPGCSSEKMDKSPN